MNELDNLNRMQLVNEFYFDQEWTDGLPVIPATPKAVDEMLQGTQRGRHELIGVIAPGGGRATVEHIAIHGVMAGCKPEYMPILIAAVKAITDERYGLDATQGTTASIAPLLIINGPVAENLGFNSGAGCFGHGTRANATVGRALCMIMLNLGKATPGKTKLSTLSQPGTFSYCIAENSTASPWEPLHVDRGFDRNDSTITALAAMPMQQINDYRNTTSAGILTTLCDSIKVLGSRTLYRGGHSVLVIPPEVASVFHLESWNKDDIKQYIYENSYLTIVDMKQGGEWNNKIFQYRLIKREYKKK